MTTDDLDVGIRQAVCEYVEAAPIAPDAATLALHEGPPLRSGRMVRAAIGLTAVAAVSILVMAVFSTDSPDSLMRTVPAQPSPATPALEAASRLVTPTLVAPTVLPRGLQFAEGGTITTSGRQEQITLWSNDYRQSAQLTWAPLTMRGGCSSAGDPPTTIRGSTEPPPSSQSMPDQAQAIRSYREGNGPDGQITWCDRQGPLVVSLNSDNAAGSTLSREQMASIATSVRRTAGDAAMLTVGPPAGFVAARAPIEVQRSKLMYRSATTATPTLWVQVEGGSLNEFNRSRVTAEPQAEPFAVGGRPAYVTATGVIVVLYDDQTIVAVGGTGLTEQDLRTAATSLAPADPALAPLVSFDGRGGLCDRLGLCG